MRKILIWILAARKLILIFNKQKSDDDINFDPKEKQYGRIILVLKFYAILESVG